MLDRSSSTPGGSTTPLQGFTGGVFKVLGAPLQVPKAIIQTSVQKNILYGATFGVIKGVGTGVAHVVGGTVQVLANAIPSNPMELVTRKLAYINAAK